MARSTRGLRPGQIRLNNATVAKILKSQKVGQMVNSAAARVAHKSGGKLSPYTTDRKAAAVSVPAEEQARDGKLTRAASAAGFRVKGRR